MAVFSSHTDSIAPQMRDLQQVLKESVPVNSPAASDWVVQGEFFGSSGAYNLSDSDPGWLFRQVHCTGMKPKRASQLHSYM